MMKSLISSLAICALLLASPAFAQKTRPPIAAGKFYPASPKELRAMLQRYTSEAQNIEQKVPENSKLRALVLPHAGYPYSGPTAAHACPVLKKQNYSKVIILGPDHRIGFQNASISDVQYYRTPLGKLELNPQAKDLLQGSALFRYIPASDKQEHSVEVVLPFLQYSLKDFNIIPIVIGSGEPKDYVQAIVPVLNSSTLLLASSDLSHSLPYSKAQSRDHETIEMILNKNYRALKNSQNRACGKLPICTILRIAQSRDWEPKLLDYSNSADTIGPRDRVVGYAAIAFFKIRVPN